MIRKIIEKVGNILTASKNSVKGTVKDADSLIYINDGLTHASFGLTLGFMFALIISEDGFFVSYKKACKYAYTKKGIIATIVISLLFFIISIAYSILSLPKKDDISDDDMQDTEESE